MDDFGKFGEKNEKLYRLCRKTAQMQATFAA